MRLSGTKPSSKRHLPNYELRLRINRIQDSALARHYITINTNASWTQDVNTTLKKDVKTQWETWRSAKKTFVILNPILHTV